MSELSSSGTPLSSLSTTPSGTRFQGERLLDEKGWKEEARGVIKEIVHYVKLFTISEKVPASASEVFLNLVTLEDATFTIRLNEQGFSVVGDQIDTVDKEGERVYETPHSLLDNLSPRYRQAWGDDLSFQLEKLQRRQSQANQGTDSNSAD